MLLEFKIHKCFKNRIFEFIYVYFIFCKWKSESDFEIENVFQKVKFRMLVMNFKT